MPTVTRPNIGQTHKMCAKCSRLKVVREFNRCTANKRSGRHSYCRDCMRTYKPRRVRHTLVGWKLKDIDIVDIRIDHAAGIKTKIIAEEFGVSPCAILRIVHRQRWGHIA